MLNPSSKFFFKFKLILGRGDCHHPSRTQHYFSYATNCESRQANHASYFASLFPVRTSRRRGRKVKRWLSRHAAANPKVLPTTRNNGRSSIRTKVKPSAKTTNNLCAINRDHLGTKFSFSCLHVVVFDRAGFSKGRTFFPKSTLLTYARDIKPHNNVIQHADSPVLDQQAQSFYIWLLPPQHYDSIAIAFRYIAINNYSGI